MGIGCPHCRVVSGDHDDNCPWHPARIASEEVRELEAELKEQRDWRTICGKLMRCFVDAEGVLFKSRWCDYGITAEEHQALDALLAELAL